MGKVTKEDKRIIKLQLDKRPRGLVDIPVRCSHGYPVVLTNKPFIRDGKEFDIFPTLYWLSCPKRVKDVSRIESDGYVSKLEEEIASNPDLKAKYREAETRYLENQRALLKPEDIAFLNKKGLNKALSRGIGGIESDRHLKCLHLHLAHHLVDNNALGKLIQDRFELEDCSGERIICDELSS